MDSNITFLSAGERTVEIIPPKKKPVSDSCFSSSVHLRVAAYCRVSTDGESQQQSYHTQKQFYTDYIQSKPGWCLAGIYADEARSGTTTKYRPEFNRMIQDAAAGKIDYIVTKSISRLARNTIDALTTIRSLKSQDPPVGVFFERENLDTLDSKGELMLTILSALAQEESRSISENIRWAIQKNFEKGRVRVDLNRMLGYDPCPDGTWQINDAQAAIVRYIFQQFSQGISGNAICRKLNHLGLTTVNGKKWYPSAIFLILRNEKYIGDCEMQKYVTENFLTHKCVKNTGQAKKFYVTNHHPSIIDRPLWDQVQIMLGKIHRTSSGTKGVSSLYNGLVCSYCGSGYSRTAYTAHARNYTDDRWTGDRQYKETYTFSYSVWRCRGKYTKTAASHPGRLSHAEKTALDQNCPSGHLYECAVKQSFMEMLYRLKWEYEAYGESCELCRTFSDFQTSCQFENHRIFSLFLRCLQELPSRNKAGLPIRIDPPKPMSQLLPAPADAADLLPFEKSLYRSFIRGGLVSSDSILYHTAFGIDLKCAGNSRTLLDFCGFRRCREDGTLELLTEAWQVNGKSVQYRKTPLRKSGPKS